MLILFAALSRRVIIRRAVNVSEEKNWLLNTAFMIINLPSGSIVASAAGGISHCLPMKVDKNIR